MARIRNNTYIVRSLMLLLCCLSIGGIAQADNYQIQASIPYPPPTQPAVVDTGLDTTTVNNALQTITGTCQVQNPENVVVIMRSGSSVGSAPCVAGNFSVQVMLVGGQNSLTPRTANASNIYGPDGAPIIVTLVLPVIPPPTTPPPVTSPQPSSPAQEVTATNAGASADLTITPNQPFSVLSSINNVTISVTVGGGEHPYDIVLNWGDGSTDTHHVDVAGVYSFSHKYLTAGSYKVHGWVHDVLGAFSEFDYAVLAGQKTPGGGNTIHIAAGGNTTPSNSIWHTIAPYAAKTVGVIAILTGAYWLGLHHALAQLAKNAGLQTRGKPKPKPKPKAKAKPSTKAKPKAKPGKRK